MSWNVDKYTKFLADMPLCESCVKKETCNDLELLVLQLEDSQEAFQFNGQLAPVKCDGYEDERKLWPSH